MVWNTNAVIPVVATTSWKCGGFGFFKSSKPEKWETLGWQRPPVVALMLDRTCGMDPCCLVFHLQTSDMCKVKEMWRIVEDSLKKEA
jgi:hypothetical protein